MTTDGSNLVAFRAATNQDAIAPGTACGRTVTLSFTSCSSALWTTEARQANTFNGPPGNGVLLKDSDLTPLGSLAFGTIGTQVVDKQFTATATAKDVCGNTKADYSGATLTRHGLTGATFDPSSGLSWSGGTGTVKITPKVTESGNTLTATDGSTGGDTGITGTSNSFTVVDHLCTSSGPCHWEDDDATTFVDAPTPTGSKTLGLGGSNALTFSCDGSTSHIGKLVLVDPQGYGTSSVTLTITYPKSVQRLGAGEGVRRLPQHERRCELEDADGLRRDEPDPVLRGQQEPRARAARSRSS